MAEEDLDPSIWYRLFSAEGKPYYYNRAKKITQWELPEVEEGKLIDLSEGTSEQQEEEDPNRQLTEEEEKVLEMEKEIERLQSKAKQKELALQSKEEKAQQAMEKKLKAEKIYTAAVWVKKWTNMTQGSDKGHGEAYYVNLETGETQWDQPEGYMSEDELQEQKMQDDIDFDRTKGVEEVLETLGITTPTYKEDRDFLYGNVQGGGTLLRNKAKLSKRQVADRSNHRMKQLFLAMKYIGDVSEWRDVFSRDNYEIAKNTYAYLGPKVGRTPDELRTNLVKIIINVTNMFPQTVVHLVDGSWRVSYELFVKHCERGMAVERRKGKLRDLDAVKAWVLLYLGILYDAKEHVDVSARPGPKLLDDLLYFMATEEEKVFFLVAQLTFGMIELYVPATTDDFTALKTATPDALIGEVLKNENSHSLIEACLYFLNQQHYPYNNATLLGQLLHVMKVIVSNDASVDMLSAADYRILLDIVITEIANLPLEDTYRVEYMRVLYMIIANTPWKSTGKYRGPDITQTLDNVIAQANYGLDKQAITLAGKLLQDFQELLT